MFRVFIKILFVYLVIIFSAVEVKAQSDCSSCHKDVKPGQLKPLKKTSSSVERGLGIMDKGQITNYLGNYGILSNFHEYFNESIRWPKEASEVIHYCFGLGLVVASKSNVITSVVGGPTDKYDWSPKDGSRGRIFSGDVTVPPPDEVAMPAEEVSLAVRQALRDARARRIRGQEVTPFLLERVRRLTRGDSLRANLGLLLNNASIAAQISKVL